MACGWVAVAAVLFLLLWRSPVHAMATGESPERFSCQSVLEVNPPWRSFVAYNDDEDMGISREPVDSTRNTDDDAILCQNRRETLIGWSVLFAIAGSVLLGRAYSRQPPSGDAE